MNGRIIKALSGFYYVATGSEVFECKARGNFRKIGISPLVGDNVLFEKTADDKGILNEILPRKNSIVRPPVANVDKLFIMSAFSNPEPNTYLIDKMSVIAVFNNIEPIIVFNKCDMGSFENIRTIYQNAGFKTFVISAKDFVGIEELSCEMKDCVSVFTGNSGVGKSSVLNAIFGNEDIATGSVSEKLGRGKHTTRHTELYELPFGGYIADTPGFSSLELDIKNFELKENLAYCFPDFEEYLSDCKFTSCTHTKEIGCAVRDAVNNNKIEKTRHESYCQLFDEMKDLKFWEANKKMR